MMVWRQGLGLFATAVCFSAVWAVATVPSVVSEPPPQAIVSKSSVNPAPALLSAKQTALQRKLAQQAPADIHIVVDTARNRLYVKRRTEVLLEAVASTGSGWILDNPGRPGTRWVFDTPRGAFQIKSKVTNPVWIKPDWAFIEEGLAVPKDPSERAEGGMLGEYALGFGRGYFIHGTLYTRLLGRNVTHGCVRLNDEDLRTVFNLANIGTPVYIF
jgi:L,D-transpeptidase ErfK/SrfK